MKFIDVSDIYVQAGKGGDGCLGFRREKYVPFGGPNGGDGGDGGSVYLKGDRGLNTLVDFRYQRHFKAKNGMPGEGSNCRGASADDLYIKVPLGTLIYDEAIEELLGEVMEHDQVIKVAQGGFHGLGNARFKSSTNRAPRQTTKGSLGEVRTLRLELKVLADVGLLGLPNAGKSTFIRSVSAARPKVADYPFTTLHPNLGVVRTGVDNSFVIADIPGIIEGAAEGAGLGIQFLRHLSRTGLLLHIVDVTPFADVEAVTAVRTIEKEMSQYRENLMQKPRWLVLNKMDLIAEGEREKRSQEITKALDWQGPVYEIAALTKQGTEPLLHDIQRFLKEAAEQK